jgi:hypothetical protein
MAERQQSFIRTLVRTLYDQQKLRISIGNRLVQIFRDALGINQEDLDSADKQKKESIAKKLIDRLKIEYKLVSEAVSALGKKKVKLPKDFDGGIKLLKTEDDIRLFEAFDFMLKSEAVYEQLIQKQLEKEAFYRFYLSNIRGVGPRMAGVIMSEIDITKCNSIAALQKYAGLDVVPIYDDEGNFVRGEGRCRKPEHLVAKTYINKKGELKETKGITFNPLLKTKLIGVLGPGFIKLGGPYEQVYRNYKRRLEMLPRWQATTPKHRHNAAVRYMVKEFLADMWTNWREYESLPVKPRYEQAKLGYTHQRRTLQEIFAGKANPDTNKVERELDDLVNPSDEDMEEFNTFPVDPSNLD